MGQNKELEKWDLYYAAPLFTAGEVQFNNALIYELEGFGYNVYNPGDYENKAHHGNPEDLVQHHIGAVRASRAVVLNLDHADEGAAFEAGVAYADNIPTLFFWTDKRKGLAQMDTNWMLTQNKRAYNLMADVGAADMDGAFGPGPVIPNAASVAEAIDVRYSELRHKGLLNNERDF